MPQRFLITGAGSGLGRALAIAALKRGHIVVGTLLKASDVAAFEALAPGRAHAVILDLAHVASIRHSVANAQRLVGPIDTLINTAEHGLEGTYEETPLLQLREQFEVNVFGTTALTQTVLPAMRHRRRGNIVFVSTVGGVRAFAGLAAYHGTKYAIEGMADALRQEVGPLGIHVMCVEPGLQIPVVVDGPTRTDIEDYEPVLDEARVVMDEARSTADPAALAEAILEALAADAPPGRLALGTATSQLIARTRAAIEAEFDAWRDLTASVDLEPELREQVSA